MRTKEVSMDRKELENQSKNTLITWLLNSEYQRLTLNRRLEKLTGCSEFGSVDGMNGSCIDCFYEDRPLFDKCWNFKFDK